MVSEQAPHRHGRGHFTLPHVAETRVQACQRDLNIVGAWDVPARHLLNRYRMNLIDRSLSWQCYLSIQLSINISITLQESTRRMSICHRESFLQTVFKGDSSKFVLRDQNQISVERQTFSIHRLFNKRTYRHFRVATLSIVNLIRKQLRIWNGILALIFNPITPKINGIWDKKKESYYSGKLNGSLKFCSRGMKLHSFAQKRHPVPARRSLNRLKE